MTKLFPHFKVQKRETQVSNGGNLSWLKNWFLENKNWEENQACSNSRLVWLNCYGIFLSTSGIHFTFAKIGSVWGGGLAISDLVINEAVGNNRGVETALVLPGENIKNPMVVNVH